ncbi:uncharacterized protein LOC115976950 [Quercus lobata]|uniref:Regulator of Vps4 activity in the MVB pathway protein n=1 Tax=Quercus lobata TaxID=97700 RepID=A0A7N2L0L2_QUELO|nr:uncharacterized protein LOC115976950 [Quercus lobata]
MLDGLLGRGFASKCKSLIKLTKTRIDVIRRKRKATEKFLKKDVADLLANGLDINAYGRADGLLAELMLSSCYDFVEHSCDFVLKHLSIMEKQSECPEECREAVSSLMFSAARFSDLPELRDLRQMFQERYGNSLELFVNQEFVTHLTSKPTTLEKKVKLMQDIAREFSIKWDAGAFEKRMSKPPTYVQNQPKTYGSFNVVDEKTKSSSGMKTVSRGEKDDFLYKERLDLNYDGHKLCNGKEGSLSKREELDLPSRRELSGKGYKALNGREETILKKDGHDTPFEGRQEIADDKHEERNWMGDATPKPVRSSSSSRGKRVECIDGGSCLLNGRENTALERDYPGSLLKGKPEITSSCAGLQSKSNVKEPFAGNNHAGQLDDTSSVRKVERNEINKVKPYHNSGIPPPYVKSNVKTKASRSGFDSGSSLSSLDNDALVDHSMHKRGNAGNTSGRIQSGSDYSDYERQVVRSASVSDHGQEKDLYQDNTTGNPLPKSKSSRRRHLKSHSHHDDAGYFEDAGVVTRKSRSRRRDDSRRGLQILFDDEHYQNEAEERILDKLLMQYSKKPSSYEPGRMRRKSKPHHAHHMGNNADGFPQNSKDGAEEKSEVVPSPARSVSLPHKHTGPSEATKVFSRAASFQPDRSNPARHVHPKLPNYEDLAAKFAAMRGS